MSDDEWTMVEMVLEEGFKGDWTSVTGRAYRIILDAFAPAQIVAALRTFAQAGRPSAGQIAGRLMADPAMPSWSDAYAAVFGRGGILRGAAQPRRWASEGERVKLIDEAVIGRARAEFHPLVAAFVETVGPARLRELDLGDPDWGEVRRDRLRRDWEEFIERAVERGRFGLPLVSLGRREGGLRRLEAPSAAGELGAGS